MDQGRPDAANPMPRSFADALARQRDHPWADAPVVFFEADDQHQRRRARPGRAWRGRRHVGRRAVAVGGARPSRPIVDLAPGCGHLLHGGPQAGDPRGFGAWGRTVASHAPRRRRDRGRRGGGQRAVAPQIKWPNDLVVDRGARSGVGEVAPTQTGRYPHGGGRRRRRRPARRRRHRGQPGPDSLSAGRDRRVDRVGDARGPWVRPTCSRPAVPRWPASTRRGRAEGGTGCSTAGAPGHRRARATRSPGPKAGARWMASPPASTRMAP